MEYFEYGTIYLMGENLKVVWAEFPTLSWAILQGGEYLMHIIHAASSKVENSAQVLSRQL
jgi:hypothetical protein